MWRGRPGCSCAQFPRRLARRWRAFRRRPLRALAAYHWPGNLRELRNAIERAVILTENKVLEPRDFIDVVEPSSDIRLGGRATLEAVENEHIRRVLASTTSLEEAAAVLGIDPATLYRRRKKLAELAASAEAA